MIFPCDMVNMEMVDITMVDMDTVDMDMVDVDMVDMNMDWLFTLNCFPSLEASLVLKV